MSEIVDQSLQKIAKGTGIYFLGTIAGLLLAFACKVIVIRYVTQSEYGILALASVLASAFAVIATLGLGAGSTRQIAYYRGRDDTSKVRGVVLSSLQLAVISSILLFLVLFFTSNLISIKIFHSPELSTPLRIFSIIIPCSVLITIFMSIFRGFDRVGPKDGYVGMEGNGPISGNPAEWGVAIVSQDPVAADCLAAQLMGFDISDIGYLWYCCKKGVGVGEISEMDILGANSEDCYYRFRPHSAYEAQKGWRDESVSRLLKI